MMIKYRNILIALASGLFIGAVVSATLVHKWYQWGEADRLETALKIANQERSAALASLKQYYESKPPIEVIKTEVEEVIKYVPTTRDCDVSPHEQRVLDYTRTGVRIPAPGTDESPGGPGTPGTVERIPRATEVRAHVDAAVKYRQCYAVAKAVNLYLKSRAEKL